MLFVRYWRQSTDSGFKAEMLDTVYTNEVHGEGDSCSLPAHPYTSKAGEVFYTGNATRGSIMTNAKGFFVLQSREVDVVGVS